MLERLVLAGSYVSKTGDISESFLKEITQIIHSLYQEKKLPKKYITTLWIEWILYLNRILNRMEALFTNSKTSD